jgi:hypothetical protein
VPEYNYGIYSYYGFRGENPGEESAKRADYTGYAQPLQCLYLRVATGVTEAPGLLDVKVRVLGMDSRTRIFLEGDQVSAWLMVIGQQAS